MSTKPNPVVLLNPMVDINYRIWTRLGYLRPQDKRRYVSLAPGIVLAILQMLYLTLSGGSLIILTIDFFLATLHCNCMVSGRYKTS